MSFFAWSKPASSAIIFLAAAVGLATLAGGQARADDALSGAVILRTRTWSDDGKVPTGTIWRTFQTWQTDIARTEKGGLVRVDPLTPRLAVTDRGGPTRLAPGASAGQGEVQVYEAKAVHGSPFPAAGWQAPDFDDSNWTRDPSPQRQLYALTARLCLRGKFNAPNPDAAGEMNLTVRYRGGAIVYINGKEIGRANVPKGEIKDDTLADEYPKEAYVDAEGSLIDQGANRHGPDNPEVIKAARIEHGLVQWDGSWNWRAVSYDNAANGYFNNKDPQVVERYRSRTRKLEVKVPPAALRRGVNVLAIQVIRSPAWEGMFTSPGYNDGRKSSGVTTFDSYWDRCELEDVKLTARSATAVVPNIAPARGVHLWTHAAAQDIDASFYGDPNEAVAPIRLRGLKNGTYSGEVVVGSINPIRGLGATVTELKGPQGSVIPNSAIQLGYPQIIEGGAGDASGYTIYDPLEPTPPGDVAASTWSFGRKFPPVQPLWVTVRVPRDAKVGMYKGTLTVRVGGESPTIVPLELEVVADWMLPDPTAFATEVSLFESPDAVAKRYKVALWSPEHWALLEKVFEVMGQLGVKDVYIPLVAKTHLANEASMVHWIKQTDGSYKLDTSIAERYLDLAVKHLGKVPRVCLWASTRSQYDPRGVELQRNQPDQPICSELDPATKRLKEFFPPKWGSSGSPAFWKPVVERMREVLAKRGLENSMMFGFGADGLGPAGDNPDGMPNHFADLHGISPQTKWMVSTHFPTKSYNVGKKLHGPDILGSHSWMFGFLFEVHWMDDNDTALWKPSYGWRDRTSTVELAASRSRSPTLWGDHVPSVTRCRVIPEAVLLTRKSANDVSYQGFGTWGADFWGDEWQAYDSYKNVALSETTMRCLVGAGQAGPVPTCRTRMFQEGLQEVELRVFVQNALLDEAQRTRLGADLARRCKETCDARERAFTYLSCFRYSDSTSNMPRLRVIPELAVWEDDMVKLAHLADEVARALGPR